MKRLAALAAVAACSGPPPVDIANGRVTARFGRDPAQLTLLVDGVQAWTTEAGGAGPPHGFAAIAGVTDTVQMMFGSFRFTPVAGGTAWQTIDKLDDVVATDTGATFALFGGDAQVGTGELTVDGLHVRIRLTTSTGGRVTLATPCGASEHFVGMGGQSFDVDQRGQTVPLWVQEDGIGKFPDPDDTYAGLWFLTGRRHSTHTPMPMLLSSQGYALAVDTNARAIFALCSEADDAARFEAWEPTLDLHLFLGEGDNAPRDALGKMIAWVGKPAERPPLATFAPWVDAIFGSANVRRVAAALRAAGISASAIWTEDWRGGATSATGYALKENWRVDRTLYPDIEQLATDLHAQGFAFLTYFNTFLDDTADVYAEAKAGGFGIQTQAGAPYEFTGVTFGNSELLDLTSAPAVAWADGVMREGITQGADGWMADFGEWQPTDAKLASGEDALAVHNRSTVDWARMTRELLPHGMFFMRSAWLHSQPFAHVIWPGDQQTDWSDGDGLPSVIPMGLGLGLTGFPYFGGDIGGYMSQGTTATTEELFYRWASFGALQPVMRTHHGRSAMLNFQWEHDAASIAHFRRWARFHMQLAAYQWGSIGSYERDGVPLFRLVALEYPAEDWAWTQLDEYLLGDRILVAPVQVQGATSRAVQLPAGTWYPLLGGGPVTGAITAQAATTEIPAFVPSGSLLVLYPDGIDSVWTTAPGADREVWLYAGHGALGTWNDELGPTGAAQWTWTGRTPGAITTATWNGAPVAVTNGTATVVGDGTLVVGDGTLTIARGLPAASALVRIY